MYKQVHIILIVFKCCGFCLFCFPAEQSLADEPLTARSETTQRSWRFGRKKKNNKQEKVDFIFICILLQHISMVE